MKTHNLIYTMLLLFSCKEQKKEDNENEKIRDGSCFDSVGLQCG